MAAHSQMVPIGTKMPSFALPDVRTDDVVKSDELDAGAVVIVFLCNHCPYVKRIASGLAEFGKDMTDADVEIVGIASNDAETYPDDSPENLARISDKVGYPFPIVYDHTQEVAKAFNAACTPDIFVFDRDHNLTYRGRFDEATPGNDAPVTGSDLHAAVAATLEGEEITEQTPSIGCSIKWKAGNEPPLTVG